MEVLIWSVLLLPGPIYSYWRRTGVSKNCPNCDMPSALVKLKSDEGWLAQRKFEVKLGVVPVTTKTEVEPPKEIKVEQPKKVVDPDKW